MSECVVRMEIPRNCYNCDLRYECNAFYAPGKPKPFMKGCRIVCQLPEGHGRLVDANKLADDMKARKAFFGRMSDPQCLVDDAPTIVPAERSET